MDMNAARISFSLLLPTVGVSGPDRAAPVNPFSARGVFLADLMAQKGGAVGEPERDRRPVVLTTPGGDSGTLRINHHWDIMPAEPPKRSIWRRLFPPMQIEADEQMFQPMIDLDLGCFYELTDGARGIVQAKGNQRGSFSHPPYITHGADDKYGSASGENLFVNLDYISQIRRILVFVYRYPLITGVSHALNPARGAVTVYPSTGGQSEIELAFVEPDARICAVLLMGHSPEGRLLAYRELRYFGGYHEDLNSSYNWELPPEALPRDLPLR